jgi:septum formation protein
MLSEQRVTLLRIFVSCPGDVAEEREVLKQVIEEINRVEGPVYGVRLELWIWTQNVTPRIGPPPQRIIDDQCPSYDIYLGIMAHRFGSPTDGYGSGTEKELRDALSLWTQVGDPWILFYFSDAPLGSRNPTDVKQYLQVCNFREECQKQGIISEYSQVRGDSSGFFEKVHEHLRKIVLTYFMSSAHPFSQQTIAEKNDDTRPRLLLTSTSPRRKALLEQIGFQENVHFKMTDISIPIYIFGRQLSLDQVQNKVLETAREKVKRVIQTRTVEDLGLCRPDAVVVGAATTVYCNGSIFDRPLRGQLDNAASIDREQAKKTAKLTLQELKGQTAWILTGLVVAQADNLEKCKEKCVVTKAEMRHFSDEDIDRYVASDEPLDKAGAFGIQGRGVVLFKEIQGSYSNVVGLPLFELYELLRDPLFA